MKPNQTSAHPLRILGSLYDCMPFKQPVLSTLRPFHLPNWLYRHLHFNGIFEVGTSVRPFKVVHYGDEIENELFWEGFPGRRERTSMSLWAKLSETAGVIVDVGANTGVYSLVAAAVNPAAQIFGFEPVAELFARYGRNCRLNGFNIRAYEAALSNTKGTGVMRGWVLERTSAARSNSVAYVATYRLDEIAETAGIDELDLLKIDVEGHEPEVLEGMGMLLSKFRPTLLIEVLSDEAGAKLESLVGTLGYVYFDLDEIGPARLVPHVRASSRWNYLVCQPSVAEALDLLQN